MNSSSCFIPGVKPGKDTSKYIDHVLDLITFPGSLGLAFVAFLPVLANYFEVGGQLAHFYGGTSMLISVPSGNLYWASIILLLFKSAS